MSALLSGELFAGYGGLALAIERVFGARTAWVADVCGDPAKGRDHKDPHGAPCTILARRFQGVPNLGNVTKVSWHKVPRVAVLGGGSPCQDLSHAGKRAGMKDGTRSGLWASMCDAIEIIRPRFVVWENVRGALSAEATAGDVESCEFCVGDPGEPPLRALGRVLGDLAELGYDAAWCGLRAADVGAPHGRFRIFVLAWDASDTSSEGLEAWGQGRARGGAATDARGEAGEQRPGLRADDAARNGRRLAARGGRKAREVALLPTPAVNDMGAGKELEAWDAWTDRMKASHGNGNGHGRWRVLGAPPHPHARPGHPATPRAKRG
ncbi:DNA cytosine methyltransferase [Luteimicrobium sp. NPDC057192]|uniref:DNA cytosine methyltransferase n=1 Tax=Luteimicrobium sp. NPDC057192 TaxID=3346042 RepID=UPI003629C9D3